MKTSAVGLTTLLSILILAACGQVQTESTSSSSQTSATSQSLTSSTSSSESSQSSQTKSSSQPDVSIEFLNAQKKAQTYSDTMHMSKKGLYKQLTSQYGEKFSPEAANFAISHISVDYNQNALEKAKTYQSQMAMSIEKIKTQLTSDYGEGFTQAEADFAVTTYQNRLQLGNHTLILTI